VCLGVGCVCVVWVGVCVCGWVGGCVCVVWCGPRSYDAEERTVTVCSEECNKRDIRSSESSVVKR